MMSFATTLLGSSLLINVASAVPTYNVKPTCRQALELFAVTGRTAEMCEATELAARAEIVKGWSHFSEADKSLCAHHGAHMAPSYVELLVCLEMHRDSRLRSEQEKDQRTQGAKK